MSSFLEVSSIYKRIELTSDLSEGDKSIRTEYSKMMKIVRLTENELQRVMRESVTRALKQKNLVVNESIDWEREIRLAQKTLMKISPLLTDLGLRLNGTKFKPLFKNVKDSLVALNDAIIDHIKKEKK